jgi:hypothetical protein
MIAQSITHFALIVSIATSTYLISRSCLSISTLKPLRKHKGSLIIDLSNHMEVSVIFIVTAVKTSNLIIMNMRV